MIALRGGEGMADWGESGKENGMGGGGGGGRAEGGEGGRGRGRGGCGFGVGGVGWGGEFFFGIGAARRGRFGVVGVVTRDEEKGRGIERRWGWRTFRTAEAL